MRDWWRESHRLPFGRPLGRLIGWSSRGGGGATGYFLGRPRFLGPDSRGASNGLTDVEGRDSIASSSAS